MTKQDHPAQHDKDRHDSTGDEKYTEPELREKIKDEINAGDKGGKPGQWSARTSQLLVHEDEQQGGGYTTEERSEDQKHLEQWQDEEWTTADGKPAERDDVMHRYLPKEAWDRMSEGATGGRRRENRGRQGRRPVCRQPESGAGGSQGRQP